MKTFVGMQTDSALARIADPAFILLLLMYSLMAFLNDCFGPYLCIRMPVVSADLLGIESLVVRRLPPARTGLRMLAWNVPTPDVSLVYGLVHGSFVRPYLLTTSTPRLNAVGLTLTVQGSVFLLVGTRTLAGQTHCRTN